MQPAPLPRIERASFLLRVKEVTNQVAIVLKIGPLSRGRTYIF